MIILIMVVWIKIIIIWIFLGNRIIIKIISLVFYSHASSSNNSRRLG